MKRLFLSIAIILCLVGLSFAGGPIATPGSTLINLWTPPYRGEINFGNQYNISLSLLDDLVFLVHDDITVSTGTDKSDYEMDVVQPTADNQGVVSATTPKYWTLTTNDYYPQQEIDDETGVTEYRLNSAATTAALYTAGLDLSQYATSSGTLKYRVVLGDAAGKKAWGYIGAADSAEAFGPELVTNGTMEADSSWANAGTPTVNERSTEQKHTGTYSRKFTVDSQYDGIESAAFSVVAGTTYTFTAWVYPDDATNIRIPVLGGGGATCFVENVTGLTQDAWNKITRTYTNCTTGAAAQILFWSTTGQVAGTWYIDDVSLQAYTALGTTAVKLYSTPAGTTQSLTGNTGIDPNAITSMEIYKTIGETALLSDQSYQYVAKFSDGQPAAAKILFSRDSNVAGTKSIYAALETTGKVTLYATEDGTTYESVTTDAAVFSNGAQTVFTDLIFVLDKTNATGAIYVNGDAVATTETISTGALLDTYAPLMIGAYGTTPAGFLEGDLGLVGAYETALSAAEAKSLSNSDAVRTLLNQ